MQMRVCGLALLTTVFCIGAVRASDDEIQWLDNYKEALQQARQTQRPIFLEFRCEA